LKEIFILFYPVNTTNCDEVKDLNDDSGNYLTTVCMVAYSATHNEAYEKCLSYGMSLYNVETSEAKKALLDFSNTRFKAGAGAFLQVQDKTSEGCNVLYNEKGLFDVYVEDCYSKWYFYCQFVRTPTTIEPGKQNRRN
jgi:hypothetical protein